MKRSINILAIALVILGMAFVGCKKPNDNPQEEETYTLTYKINNEVQFTNPLTGEVSIDVLSPCFHFDITYIGADGNPIEEHNVSAPWEKTLSIHRPFHAKLEGRIIYNEDELPEEVTFGKPYYLSITGNGVVKYDDNNQLSVMSKSSFLEHIAGTERLSFESELTLE